jgi:hypothetical protein
MHVVTLADLETHRLPLRAEEAVAVVLGLGDRLGWATSPPEVARITLTRAGSIDVTPFEPQAAEPRAYAQLLDQLLPEGVLGDEFKVPGALRLVVARGLGQIDLPPFPDATALAATLRRFVSRPIPQLVAAVVSRTAPAGGPRGVAPLLAGGPPRVRAIERRTTGPRVDVLRQLLREADMQRYALIEAAKQTPAQPWTPTPRPSSRPVGRDTSPATSDAVSDLPLRSVPRRERASADERPLRHSDESVATGSGSRVALPLRAGAVVLALAASFGGSYTIVRELHERAERRAREEVGASAGVGTAATAEAGPKSDPESLAGGGPAPAGVASVGHWQPSSDSRSGVDDASEPEPAPAAAAGRRAAVSRLAAAHPLPLDEVRTYSPSFTPDGDSVYFHAESGAGSRLMRADIDPHGRVTALATVLDDGSRNFHVRVAPDGTRIAFDSDREGERAVFVANPDGTGVRRVSQPGYAAVPAWAPDGTRLAFLRAEPAKARVWNLWTRDLTSGAEARLTEHAGGQAWPGAWLPGERLVYTHEDRLHILDTRTGQRVSFGSPRRGRLVRTAAVSPDARRVAFQVHRDGMWVLDLEDGSMRRVLDDPTAEEFAWAPSGTHVAYHSRRAGQWRLWMAPLEQNR